MTTVFRSLLLKCEINGPVQAVFTEEGRRMIEEARNAAPDPRDVEIARLRALVEAAYREAHGRPSPLSDDATDREWEQSEARKALDQK